MKYSKALLNDREIGLKLFQNSVDKAKEFLTDIFGLIFDKKNPNILDVSKDEQSKTFEISFLIGTRNITATLSYENCYDDIVQEVLKIKESVIQSIPVDNISSDYQEAVNSVMDILEETYDIDFTPLELSVADKNIKSIHNKPEDHLMEVVFTHEDHEAIFKAVFRLLEDGKSSLIVQQDKQHLIYFE